MARAAILAIAALVFAAHAYDWDPVVSPPPSKPCTIIPSRGPCSVTCGEGTLVRNNILKALNGPSVECEVNGEKLTLTTNQIGKPVGKPASEPCSVAACVQTQVCAKACPPSEGLHSCVQQPLNGSTGVEGVCRCKPGWVGEKCTEKEKEPRSLCIAADFCANGGQCIIYGKTSTAGCICKPDSGFTGPQCKTDACVGCKNNATCFHDSDDESIVCECGTLWGGEKCDMPRTDTTCNLTCTPGTCVPATRFGVPYCACNGTGSGLDCSGPKSIKSSCQAINTMNCILGVTADDKCAAVDKYIDCAKANQCDDMAAVWCATLPWGCKRNMCDAIIASHKEKKRCDLEVYKACYWHLRRVMYRQDSSSRAVITCSPALFASCAAAASCPDLLNTYCGQNIPQCSNFPMPADCALLSSENVQGLVNIEEDHHALGSGHHLAKFHARKSAVRSFVTVAAIVGAAVAVVAVVAAAVVIRRRRQAPVSEDYMMM